MYMYILLNINSCIRIYICMHIYIYPSLVWRSAHVCYRAEVIHRRLIYLRLTRPPGSAPRGGDIEDT